MATKPFGVWGIDLGQCALKALRMEIGEDGAIVATAFDYVEHPKILSQPDADPDQLTREALEKFLSRNTLRGDQVAISVPGQSGLARFVKLPPVEDKKIGDIVRFEAKQQIPFNLEEVVWDYQKIGSGAVTDGFAMETEIGLFAMKRDMVNRYLQHFKDVNVEVHIVQMAPLALCNFVAYDLLGKNEGQEAADPEATTAYGKKQCVVALDIGADSSNLIITDGGRIIWQRPIPLGGNHFTRALTKDMKLTFAKAEHLKRNATKSPDLKQILSSLKPVLNDFVGEVQRSLGYFTNTHRDANILYMVGLGNAFRLPGLQRFLSEKLQMEVRKLSKLERLVGDSVVTAPAYTENVLSYGVAYGLALQGLHQAHLKTNLLPPEIRMDRMVRGKKPWAAAAAAALLLGGAAVAFSYHLEVRAYGGAQKDDENKENVVVKAKTKSKQVVSTADKWNKDFLDQVKKADDEERAVKSIIAGQDERENWLKLQQFISSVLPYPEVHIQTNQPVTEEHLKLANLPKEGSKYVTPQAEYAFEVYKKKQETGSVAPASKSEDSKPSKVPDLEEESQKYLVQINIESVDTRYTDDLAAAWNAIKNSSPLTEGRTRPVSQYKEAPKDKEAGWVVELRGYTYHDDRDSFVVNTLLENIARKGIPATATTPAAGKDTAPPATQPTTPSPSGSTSPTDKKETTPKPAEKSADQVLGQISHAVLYKISDNSSGGSVSLGSALSTVVTSTGGAPAGEGGKGGLSPLPGGAPNPSGGFGGGLGGGGARSSWKPLGAGQGGSSSLGMGGSGFKGMVPQTSPPPGVSGGPKGMPGFGQTSGSPPSSASGTSGPKGIDQPGTRKRTEFIVLFFWREPIPSDKLRSMQESTGATTPGAGGFPGSMPGFQGTMPPSGPPGGG
ncbi:MAG TPA: type IV pilus assembly protein PilM [Gemmataceae bacterium]|nr:type IV pilus assembly protein PilM [Gemmataceae bacterium]